MFLAIDRRSGLFDKETSDQINTRINNLDGQTRYLGNEDKEREFYYNDCRTLPINFKIPIEYDSSFQYGKAKIINFSFKMPERSITEIAEIPGYEAQADYFANASDNEGNAAVVSLSKDGILKFANIPQLSGTVAIYIIIII